jgi:hypothetical protein
MKVVNALLEELRTLIGDPAYSVDDRFRVAMNRIAGFLADAFGGEKDEVAVLWSRGDALRFVWPEYLAQQARDLPLNSPLPIAATIFRSGRSFLDNKLLERDHMVEYEFIKDPDGGSRMIWKMMGAAVTVDGQRLGVVQVSRKRGAFSEPGPDFTPGDLDLLEKILSRLGPLLLAVVPG